MRLDACREGFNTACTYVEIVAGTILRNRYALHMSTVEGTLSLARTSASPLQRMEKGPDEEGTKQDMCQ